MECGESLQEAAARETLEETGIDVSPEQLRFYAVSSLTYMDQVYIGFSSTVAEHVTPICGPECLDAGFFSEEEVPWRELAFNDMAPYLSRFFEDAKHQRKNIHFDCLKDSVFDYSSYPISATEQRVIMPSSLLMGCQGN